MTYQKNLVRAAKMCGKIILYLLVSVHWLRFLVNAGVAVDAVDAVVEDSPA